MVTHAGFFMRAIEACAGGWTIEIFTCNNISFNCISLSLGNYL